MEKKEGGRGEKEAGIRGEKEAGRRGEEKEGGVDEEKRIVGEEEEIIGGKIVEIGDREDEEVGIIREGEEKETVQGNDGPRTTKTLWILTLICLSLDFCSCQEGRVKYLQGSIIFFLRCSWN